MQHDAREEGVRWAESRARVTTVYKKFLPRSAPWGGRQSLRELQGKEEYLRSEAERQHNRVIKNQNEDRNKS